MCMRKLPKGISRPACGRAGYRLQMLVCIDCKHGPDTCVRPDDGMYPVNTYRQICDGPAFAGCECDYHNCPEWLDDLDKLSPLIEVDRIMLGLWGA